MVRGGGRGSKRDPSAGTFEQEYFCQQRRYDFLSLCEACDRERCGAHGHAACRGAWRGASDQFYERDVNNMYNSIACIDADGTVLGVYRKTHIPDDHYYQEKFYFTPGGYRISGIFYALRQNRRGDLLGSVVPGERALHGTCGGGRFFYPTAIGSEPILECDSMPHWRRCMQGHAAANLMPVIAANRIGEETVEPCEENGGQRSALVFTDRLS